MQNFFSMSRIDYIFCIIWIPPKTFTCSPVVQLRTEFTILIAKSTSPGLLDTSLPASCVFYPATSCCMSAAIAAMLLVLFHSVLHINFIAVLTWLCICCGSVLSLVQILFSFVSNSLSYITIPKNKEKQNLNQRQNWTTTYTLYHPQHYCCTIHSPLAQCCSKNTCSFPESETSRYRCCLIMHLVRYTKL